MMKKRNKILAAVIASMILGSGTTVLAEVDTDLVKQCWEELKEIEARDQILWEEGQKAVTQREMNANAGERFALWDDEINVLWGHLKVLLDENTMSALTQDEIQWIYEKEAKIAAEGAAYEGGTMRPMVEDSLGAELTKERVYVLMEYLPDVGLSLTENGSAVLSGSFQAVQTGEEHERMYNEILAQYREAQAKNFYLEGMEPDPMPEYLNPSMLSLAGLTNQYRLYYSYADINGDGVDELLIGGGASPEMCTFVDVYGYAGNLPLHYWNLYDLGQRVYLSLYTTGVMEISWSDSAADSGYDFYTPAGNGSYNVDSISVHGDFEDEEEPIKYYHSMMKENPITDTEFYEIYQQKSGGDLAEIAWMELN